MKTKMLIAAAMLGAASMSAHAGVRFGFSLGLPLPVVVAAPPVVAVAPPVVVGPPVVSVGYPGCYGPAYYGGFYGRGGWGPGYGYGRFYGRPVYGGFGRHGR